MLYMHKFIYLFTRVFSRSANTRAYIGKALAQEFRYDGIVYYDTGGKQFLIKIILCMCDKSLPYILD